MNVKAGYPPAAMHWQVDLEHERVAAAAFTSMAAASGFKILVRRELAATDRQLAADVISGELVVWSERHKWRYVVIRRGDAGLLMVAQGDGQTIVEIAAATQFEVEKIFDEIRTALPPIAISSEPELPFVFWHHGECGATANQHKVAVVPWAAVAVNYAAQTRTALDALMNTPAPGVNRGRLLLWHGKPGTGKTFAARALAWAWRDWCRIECVIDPEHLFGAASYLTEVTLHEDDEEEIGKWRLLVLEDAGEMMSIDARRRFGQGLSRLLNLTDGLIGQGRKLMILVTTNEELGKLHPAVVRPGRCFHRSNSVR